MKLQELADHLGVELRGDGQRYVQRVDTLERADDASLCFFGDRKYQAELGVTRAVAVILEEKDVGLCPVAVLVSANPYLTYARVARLLHPEPAMTGGIHPSVVVAHDAHVDPSAWIGAMAVVEEAPGSDRGSLSGRAASSVPDAGSMRRVGWLCGLPCARGPRSGSGC